MNEKLLLLFSLFIFQFSFSQNEELILGKVLNQNKAVPEVDVINFNTKEQTKTDKFGNFSIAAKNDDLLIFVSKNYELKRLLIRPNLYDKKDLSVFLDLKAEELEEVVITKMDKIIFRGDKAYEKGEASKINVINSVEYIKKRTVYEGTIDNGTNIIALGVKLFRLLVKPKEQQKNPYPKIEFATLAKKTCNENFFKESLKLKPEEMELFLQFCDADPKSKKVSEQNNVLSMMDFLAIKNMEFQKLK